MQETSLETGLQEEKRSGRDLLTTNCKKCCLRPSGNVRGSAPKYTGWTNSFLELDEGRFKYKITY